MSFLPIVWRELRMASRRKSTYRLRWWVALIAMVAGFIALSLVLLSRTRANYGNPVFSLLTGYAFGLCLLAGVLLTADALSQEKREGTLGLLFLSNLKGYDVVLGKLMATSLNAFYGLLALLPVTGVPLMLGGVEGAEYWRMALALMNTLFFSLAVGLGLSAFMWDGQRARANALLLVLVLAGGLPALAQMAIAMGFAPGWVPLTWVSPFYPYWYASDAQYTGGSNVYWSSLVLSHLVGWAFLAAASVLLPRLWRERPGQVPPVSGLGRWPGRVRIPWPPKGRRAEVLAENPVLWLVRELLGFQWAAWLVVTFCAVTVVGTWWIPRGVGFWSLSAFINLPFIFGFLLKVLFAFQVCRFFAEGRRSGSLELLLCTPLTNLQITSGQATALWAAFGWPLTLFTGIILLPASVNVVVSLFRDDLGQAAAAIPVVGFNLLYCLCMCIDLMALCWLGMWLALSMKKPQYASLLTIVLVLILPAVLCYFSIITDVLFITWGMGKMHQDLRWRLAQQRLPPTDLRLVRGLAAARPASG